MEDQLYYEAVFNVLSGISVPASNPDLMYLVADVVRETKRRHDALIPKTDNPTE